jgi:type II secretory pathway predicted ATPase ExeA
LFTEFHGLSANPFTIMPNPRLAWLGAGMRKLRAELYKAVLEGRSLVILSGDPGVGKSLALTLLASDLKQSGAPCRIHSLNGIQVSATDPLRSIAEDAGDDSGPTGPLTVLLIDEAERLGSAELGALLQETALRGDRLRLVLAGAPELELVVKEVLAEHPVVVATRWWIDPLPPDEISFYIAGQLHAVGGGCREIFTPGAVECLTRHSGGVPRRLNVLCSTALFLAWREGRQDIDASIVDAALPAFNARGSLTDMDEPLRPVPMATSMHRPLIESPASQEVKDPPVGELESAVLEASAASAALDGVRSEVVEVMSATPAESGSIRPETNSRETTAHGPEAARRETCEYATDMAVAATPVSREIAQLHLKTNPVVQLHRALVPIGEQVLLKSRRYVPLAGVAAIVFLLVAIVWQARDEQPAGNAIAPMTLVTILPADPPTNQPTAPSPGPRAANPEPVLAEESPAPVMQPENDYAPKNDGQMSSAAEPVDMVSVYVDPRYAEEGVEGRPPQTIGPEELAELLARAHQQIETFALMTPPGDNALETLQRVLAVMPTQPDALQGIREIATRYAVLATQAERRGEHDLAKRYVDKGLHLVPDSPDLLAIQKNLGPQPAFQLDVGQPARSGGETRVNQPARSAGGTRR